MYHLIDPFQSASLDQIVKAVVNCGCADWFEIGVELKYNERQLTSMTGNKPTGSGKLSAIIHRKRAAVSEDELRKLLKTACSSISSPIIGSVSDELMEVLRQDRAASVARGSVLVKVPATHPEIPSGKRFLFIISCIVLTRSVLS